MENKTKYEKSCKICQQIKQLSTIENNIPLKIEKNGEHPLDKHFQKELDHVNMLLILWKKILLN